MSSQAQLVSANVFAHKFPTTFGTMAIAWRGEKVVATRLPDIDDIALLAAFPMAAAWGKEPPPFVLALAAQISLHLAGQSQKFPLDILFLEKTSPFFRRVYERVHAIPTGKVLTYGEVAREAGSPLASRAVGQAMARNPFPIVVPCHRVMGGKNALVGFSAPGGVITKKRLLDFEMENSRGH